MFWTPIWLKHISGTINHDTTFFHMGLSDFPAQQVTVEYFIRYNSTKMEANCFKCYPILGLHTTDDDVNTRDQCFSLPFGQVRNENLRIPLKAMHTYDSYRWTSLSKQQGLITAKAKIKIYDFKERNFSFSLGFQCTSLTAGQNVSLKGVHFDIHLIDLTKESILCEPVDNFEGILQKCPQYYSHMSENNLVGWTSDENAKLTPLFIDAFQKMMLNEHNHICYQHIHELICYLFIPECKERGRIVVHLCQEMCYDFLDACWNILLQAIPKIKELFPSFVNEIRRFDRYENLLDCSYLPSQNESIPCHYQPVTCGDPPIRANARVSHKYNVTVNSTAEYTCTSDNYKMVGNATVTCMFSGHWSPPPTCVDDSLGFNSPVAVVLVVLSLPLAMFVSVVLWYRHKNKSYHEVPQLHPRDTEFDAFLCYNFDRENNYVVTEFLPEIDADVKNHEVETEDNHCLAQQAQQREKKRTTQKSPCLLCARKSSDDCDDAAQNEEEGQVRHGFKILIESRDFVPALLIDTNIENAIKKSNCVIMLISQGFVNSVWCRKEFELCKLESEKDASFKVFVIMMQPVGELQNVSSSMRRFFETTTFLKKDDPGLMKKLSYHLTELRKVNGSPV